MKFILHRNLHWNLHWMPLWCLRFYPRRTQRSRRFFHEEHDWQLSLLESLQQESVASCSDAPQCLQRFTCITLCRRTGGRYSPKFGNGVFLLYLCSWNLRNIHQTIHVVRFIRVIITWILWNQSQSAGTPKRYFSVRVPVRVQCRFQCRFQCGLFFCNRFIYR